MFIALSESPEEIGKKFQYQLLPEVIESLKFIQLYEPQYDGETSKYGRDIHEPPSVFWEGGLIEASRINTQQFEELCKNVAGFRDEDTKRAVYHFKNLKRIFDGQQRKNTGEPAYWHPRAVAINNILLLGNKVTFEQTITDLNHDSIEDNDEIRNGVSDIILEIRDDFQNTFQNANELENILKNLEMLHFLENNLNIKKSVYALTKSYELFSDVRKNEYATTEYYRNLSQLFLTLREMILNTKGADRIHYLITREWEEENGLLENYEIRASKKKAIETAKYLLQQVEKANPELGVLLKQAILLHVTSEEFNEIELEDFWIEEPSSLPQK